MQNAKWNAKGKMPAGGTQQRQRLSAAARVPSES